MRFMKGEPAVPKAEKMEDRAYLLEQQYADASNLDARIALHARFSTNRYGWFRWVFDHLDLPPQARVLEVGCGTGLLWRENLDRLPPGWNLTLTDFSPGMVQQARQNLQGSGHTVAFETADAQALPFADHTFDAVIANHVLFHVRDRTAALAELRRVLRPGGRLVASTLGARHLQELNDLTPGRAPGECFGEEYGFSLENGGEQLAACFSSVALYRYDDGLVVTEAAPLVAYIMSSPLTSGFDAAARGEVVRRVEAALAADGAIRIGKEGGLFVAA
jgi:SAM-dependent methyltransferase